VVRQAAEAKGIALAINVDPTVGSLVADPDRLQQIVWNLVSNAVKFTPARGEVEVSARRVSSSIRLCVRDTGLGIPAEHLPFVFERLRQVDGTTTRHYGGLGLGLAIVRHLVEAHGGTVSAHSEGSGQGATFTVDLPIHAVHVKEPEVDDDTVIKDPAPSAATHSGSLSGSHILIVEDDEDSLELLRVVLEGAGASTARTNRAAQALEAASQTKFDVIISDIGMPEMDGYMFMRKLRKRVAAEEVPAIALTAYARPEDAAIALKAGYQEHMTKPVDATTLIAAIQRLVTKTGVCSPA
jgi:CheY-like chemotaxis protein